MTVWVQSYIFKKKKKKVPLIFLDFYKANGRCDGRGENRKFLPRMSHQKNELENFK